MVQISQLQIQPFYLCTPLPPHHFMDFSLFFLTKKKKDSWKVGQIFANSHYLSYLMEEGAQEAF